MFSQTGQRAYVAGFGIFNKRITDFQLEEYAKALGVHEKYWRPSMLLRAAVYVSCLNKFEDADDGRFFTRMGGNGMTSDHDVFRPGMWHGSILQRDEVAMEFSGAAAKRGARMMALIASIGLFQACNGRRISKEEIQQILSDGYVPEQLPALAEVAHCINLCCDLSNFYQSYVRDAPLSFLALSYGGTSDELGDYPHYKDFCVERIDWIADQIS